MSGYRYSEEEGLFDKMNDMNYEEKQIFLKQYAFLRKDRSLALILSILFGPYGIDQFYINENRTGIIKLILASLAVLFYFIFHFAVAIITLGVLGVLVIANWLAIQEEVDEYNRNLRFKIEMYIKKMRETDNNGSIKGRNNINKGIFLRGDSFKL